MMCELATRELYGYPDTTAELHVNFTDNTFEVVVIDPIGEYHLTPDTREQAKDMYFHPFAYGYTAPDIHLSLADNYDEIQ